MVRLHRTPGPERAHCVVPKPAAPAVVRLVVIAAVVVIGSSPNGHAQVLIQRGGGGLQLIVPGNDVTQFAGPVRFPGDRRSVRQFRAAEQQLKEAAEAVRRGERWDRAAAVLALRSLQQLLEHGEDSLFDPTRAADEEPPAREPPAIPGLPLRGAQQDGSVQDATALKSLRELAETLLLQLPGPLRTLYEQEFGPQAGHLLREATASHRVDALMAVARAFPGTAAGRRALFLAAVLCADSGDYRAAARLLERLRRDPLAEGDFGSLAVMVQTACLFAAGETVAAEKLWAAAGAGTPKVWRLGARTVEARRVPDVLREQTRGFALVSERPATEWRMFGGGPSRDRPVAPFSPVGGPLWVRDLWELSPFRTTELPAGGQRQVVTTAPQVVGGLIIRQQSGNAPEPPPEPVTLREAIERTQKELEDAGRPPVIAAQPLVVGGRVIVRGLDRVRAFDLSTGELAWESVYDDPVAAELFDAEWADRVVVPSAVSAQDMLAFLSQRLWHDLTTGTLSSDGRQVYCIEKDGFVFATRVVSPTGESPRLGPKDTNRLLAYEVATGRLRWQVGGPRGPHELPLAGVFFLGPPLPLHGRLYSLAEEGGDIRLLCLDPEHGTLRWAQTIASPDLSVMDDARRRLSGLQPAYADGLLVCPTGAGAIVAFDLLTRRIAWARRYREPSPDIDPNSRAAFAFMIMRARMMGLASSLQQLSQPRWLDGVPRMAAGHLVITPPETGELLCYRLRDGALRWKRPRGDGLWVAAVLPDRVVVVARGQIEAYRLSDGQPAWPAPLPLGIPSGRGVRVGTRYVLPLQSNELAVIDLNDGRVLLRAPQQQPVGGNLAAGNGSLVIQGSSFVVAFPPLETIQQKIADGLKWPEQRAAAVALRGELRLAQGMTDAGLDDLQQALKETRNERLRTIVVGALLENLRRDGRHNEQTLELIQQLIEDSPRRADYFRVYVDGLTRTGRRREAFAELLRFAESIEEPTLETIGPSRRLRTDRWVRTQFTAMLSGSDVDPQIRQQAEQWIATRLAEDQSAASVRRLLTLFGGTPLADSLRRRLIDQWMTSESEPLACEQQLLTLSHSADERMAGWANAQLLKLWRRHRRYEAMPYRLMLLATRFAHTQVDTEMTGRQMARRFLEHADVRESLKRFHWQWQPLVRIQVQAPSTGAQAIRRSYPLERREDVDAALAGWTFELDDRRQNVIAFDGLKNERWRLPLAELQVRPPDTTGNYCLVRGHLLVLVLGETCVAVDALDHTNSGVRVLWKKRLSDVDAAQLVRIVANVNLGRGRPVLRRDSQGRALGNVGGLSDDVVALQIGGRLIGVDPLDSETLWVREGLPRGMLLSGEGGVLVGELVDDDSAVIVRMDDGEVLETRLLPPLNARAAVIGRRLISVHHNVASTLVMATDLATGLTLWQRELVPRIRTSPVLPRADEIADHCLHLLFEQADLFGEAAPAGDRAPAVDELFHPELLALDPRGELVVIDLQTGKTRFRRNVHPQGNLEQVVVRRSRFGYTVLTRTPITEPGVLRISGLTSDDATVHGWCFGLQRQTGQVLWQRLIDKQSVTLEQPLAVPTLLFAGRQFMQKKRPNGGTFSLATYRVGVLDVRSGVFREVSPTSVTFVRLVVRPNPAAQYVEYDLGRSAVYARFGTEAPAQTGPTEPGQGGR